MSYADEIDHAEHAWWDAELAREREAETTVVLGKITRHGGIADQVSYSVTATYPGEDPSRVTFVGSLHGGPVVMVTESGAQTFVRDPGRFGTFGEAWVRAFFA